MNKRIQQFLEIENLSPSKLADMLGLQRSGISHILAGRNKPSYDFILKFLRTFPNINPDWLLMGKGKIYRNGENDQNNQNEENTPQLSINFEENQEFYEESDEATEIKIIEKKINRITLFYNDGSFQEFYPNK
ncbi:MAG: helix-turn-helix transcriptional regulator [Bacteroidales bacterium]|jgi:transcriptional regulator with XRE-family HTH domain|nr:helix-turn-helix transcriptional regulator [Bacteroidales bacterium]MBO7256805.1 helix-turn-helix transcriptional regulator [Bacteroidales bacterium]